MMSLLFAGLTGGLLQIYLGCIGVDELWRILLSIGPTVVSLHIFEEIRKKAKARKIMNETSKLKEEDFIFSELEKIARNHYIWCRNERITKTPTLCVYLDCSHKKYSTDIPSGCSKCQMFQMTDQNKDWSKAKRTHDFATVNTKVKEGE